MEILIGHATQFEQVAAPTAQAVVDNNHAWQVLFAYEGPKMALREISLGPLPGKFPSLAIRQVVMDKHKASEESIKEVSQHRTGAINTCVLCKLAFGSTYNDPNFGPITVTRNRRNKFYCNTCDMFLRICPGQTTLQLPVMVVDVKGSRKIRNKVSLLEYSKLVADFQCRVAAVVQKNLGMVLNTVGDAVIGIWPSGFVPEELRKKYNWDEEVPAKVPAQLALKAAQELANLTPADFDGKSLPFKGALDCTEMVIFSVNTSNMVAQMEYSDLDEALGGAPLVDDEGNLLAGVEQEVLEREAFQKGPTSTDIAGEAIELTSELSGHDVLGVGDFAITKRLDQIAGDMGYEYRKIPDFNVSFRVITPE
ncbi:MAG: hypothetical protein R3252_03845 [Robiginitalea sp.]|nr:hypothetical protein [Robiginitalea sp.]